MKTLKLFFLLIVMNLSLTVVTLSQQKNDTARVKLQDSVAMIMKQAEKMQKEYARKMEEQENMNGQQNSLFGVRLDLILGYTSSNANYETNTNAGGVQTNIKNGAFGGANITLNLMGFSFTTGVSYSSKGFKTDNGNDYNMNYFNLPFLLSFNFNIGKVLIEPSFGPYVGIMLSGNNDSMYKNIDIGALGSIQGSYMFQKHLGALVGFKYEYGGLNNLSKNSTSDLHTKTWTLYSGLKIVF